jgi:hypothetical protein
MRMTGGIFWWMFAVVPVSTSASAEVNTPAAPAEPSAGGGNDVLSGIVVKAQKRSQKLSDVPMSITAATGDQLRNLGVNPLACLLHKASTSAPAFETMKRVQAS